MGETNKPERNGTMTTIKFNLKKYQEIIDNLAAVGCKPGAIKFLSGTEILTGKLVKGKIPMDFVHTSVTKSLATVGVEIVGGDFYGNENDANSLWSEDGIRG